MSNLKDIMLLKEESAHRAVFVNAREEGGINTVYDPENDQEIYQVFIHNRFPYRDIGSWEFDTFSEARNFAASKFKEGWDFLMWNMKTNRPCEGGDGKGCGKGGSCSTGGKCGGNAKSESTDGSGGCGSGGCSSCE